VALYLAERGVKVMIGDLDQAKIQEAERKHSNIRGKVCNVTDENQVAGLMEETVKVYGQINIVVASAGIISDGLMVSPDRETGKVRKVMSAEQFRKVIDVNLVGCFLTLRESVSRMVDNSWEGVLIPISSINKEGAVGQLNYSSTKAAVALWPKILAGEFSLKGIGNIRIVGVAPGYVGTPILKGMNPKALEAVLKEVHIGRLIEPEEVAFLIEQIILNEALDATTVEITGGVLASKIAK
jgi:3-oxoacyl-[acyl-carrier protein] reductase